MLDEGVDLDEGARVQQQIDPFPCRELAGFVLTSGAFLSAALARASKAILELVEGWIVRSHGSRSGAPPRGTSDRGAFEYHTIRKLRGSRAALAGERRTIRRWLARPPSSTSIGGGVARGLSLISDRPEDLVDAFFERREEIEWAPPGVEPRLRVLREEGLAVRLVRDDRQWLAVRDDIGPTAYADAVRRVARGLTQGVLREPRIRALDWDPQSVTGGLRRFAERVEAALHERRLAFAHRLRVRRHRRWVRVVDRDWAGDGEEELFYSCRVETAWGPWGTLVPELDEAAVRTVADALAGAFLARRAAPPVSGTTPLLLGPSAAAVFLHEAVAHALEVDTLALGGDPASAVGLTLGAPALDLLDDPQSGPEGLRRTSDDEGAPVLRRWLLRRGVVEQPLADRRWCRGSEHFSPGSARRDTRRLGPAPRSLHLELLPGEHTTSELATEAGSGLFAGEAASGRLDPRSGEFELEIAHGRRFRDGQLDERVGPFRMRGRVGEVLHRVAGVGRQASFGGAGWCAKGGRRMPVWSTTPALLVDGVEVEA